MSLGDSSLLCPALLTLAISSCSSSSVCSDSGRGMKPSAPAQAGAPLPNPFSQAGKERSQAEQGPT